GVGGGRLRSVYGDGSAEAQPRTAGSDGSAAAARGGDSAGEDAGQSTNARGTEVVCPAENDRRAGIWADQGRARVPAILVAGLAEDRRRMVVDLLDAQSAQNLALPLRR